MQEPFVTLIVPVFNDEAYLTNTLQSLSAQDYPKDRLEILVVDNNSQDGSAEIIKNFGGVTYLLEKSVQSSYAARNFALGQAKGDVIAFTDSDCILPIDWVSKAVSALEFDDADMVTGPVRFTYQNKPTPAEMYDALTNLQIKEKVDKDQATCTCNLVVKKKVFDQLGLFDQTVQSGGDLQWTAAASRAGFRLKYLEDLFIFHPARDNKELLKKAYRVGKGAPYMWKKRGLPYHYSVGHLLRKTLPRNPSYVGRLIQEKGTQEMFKYHKAIWWVSYQVDIAFLCGVLTTLMNLKK